jgi:hypothetical protein
MPGTSRSGGDRVANGHDSFPRDGLPSRPTGMSKAENETWTMVMNQLPNELLRRVDCHNLRTLCECIVMRDKLISLLRDDPVDRGIMNNYIKVGQQISRLSAQYGLSPIDRRRMKIEASDDLSSIDEWSDS